MHIKPNFIYINNDINGKKKDYVLFVGRLTREKGIFTLIKTAQNIK